ncbi:MAG: peptidase U32 family protein [Helicobacter sp.]|nr:peptidase U32 family protein [Helicobacter sp.]
MPLGPKKIQLLCPAGNLHKLKIAINYGADAVYGGVSHFSLRSRASLSFDFDTFKEGIDYAHSRGKKVFATINGFPFNSQIRQVTSHIEKIATLGVDAFIIATIGLLKLARQIAPHIPVHLSTQANVLNVLDARAFYELGAKRIVAAREISLKDLIAIKNELPDLELEIFVHGSMCFAFSGRCLISALQSARMPNRGSCANDCRFDYEIYAKSKESDALFRLEETPGVGTHIFNSKDLNLSAHLHEILQSGAVDALKIEGRTKSSYYAGITARTYKMALEDFYSNLNENELKERKKIYNFELHTLKHRGFTDGYIIHRPYEKLDSQNHDSAISDGSFQVCGEVIESGDKFLCKYSIFLGDEMELVAPLDTKIPLVDNEIGSIIKRNDRFYITFKKLIATHPESSKIKELNEVHSGNVHLISLPIPICAYAFLRKKMRENDINRVDDKTEELWAKG